MRILITNDDGIKSEGLKCLCKAALKYGEVTCIAPLVEQSGKSHSIDIKAPFLLKEVDEIIPNVKTYVVNSTPGDCVRVAFYHLDIDFDLVLSGVNDGYNLGEDILYSGTMGAASEAVLCGRKAIAFSTKRHYFSEIDKYVNEMLKFVFDNKLLEKANLWNINICENPKGIKFATQGCTHFDAYFDNVGEELVLSKGSPDFSREKDNINSDVYYIYNHFITITPLVVDRTDYNVLNKFLED